MASPNPSSFTSNFFLAAAALNAVCIPGHVKYGIDNFYPIMRHIQDRPATTVGKACAINCWDHANVSMAVMGMCMLSSSVQEGERLRDKADICCSAPELAVELDGWAADRPGEGYLLGGGPRRKCDRISLLESRCVWSSDSLVGRAFMQSCSMVDQIRRGGQMIELTLRSVKMISRMS